MHKKIVLVLLFALLVAIFSIQNANRVLIRLLKWKFEVSLVLIVLGAIVFGSLLMAIVTSITRLKLSKKIRIEIKEKNDLARELKELRSDYQELVTKIQEKYDESNDESTIHSSEDKNSSEIEIKDKDREDL